MPPGFTQILGPNPFAAPKVKRSRAKERAVQRRDEHWPNAKDVLWDKKAFEGFTTIPRTLPLVMQAMDSLCKNAPPSSTYFVLWCRTFDEHLLVIENPGVLAAESGFTGQRAVTTWNARMKSLLDLGFIDARPGPTGDFQTVLLKNPNQVMQQLKPRIQPMLYSQFIDRGIAIGAKDIAVVKPAV